MTAEEAAAAFDGHRGYLTAVAYRMLGSLTAGLDPWNRTTGYRILGSSRGSEDALQESLVQSGASRQERHNVVVPRRKFGPLAACIAALALAACTTGYSSAAPSRLTGSASSRIQPIPHVHASYRPGVVYVSRAAHVYRGGETFCLRAPLSGTARYFVHAGRASFTLDIHGLPPTTGVGVDWINNPVRGYLVGAFTTDAAGGYVGAAQTFRPGEVRAVAIKFQRSDGTGLPGIGKPCRD